MPPTDRPAAIHAPWQPGQYVSYFLDRDDRTWAAFCLRVLGQDKAGEWVIRGDFMTVGGDSHVFFCSRPGAEGTGLELVPVQQQLGRRFLPEGDSPDAWLARPEMQITLAMNLFLLRQAPGAIDALCQPARPVSYPCGIVAAHPFVSAAPNFQKHHDLCPRVPVTGVAGMSMDGKRNPITVTSFGCSDPQQEPYTYDDWIDWSHVQPTRHEGFTLSYPATWFLLPQPSNTPGETHLATQIGGNTCAGAFSVSVRTGAPEDLRKHRDETLARQRGLGGEFRVDPQPLRFAGGAEGVAADTTAPAIVGVYRSVLFPSPDGTRLAQVTLYACVSRNHPDRDTRLAEMAPAFQAILESMRWD